MKPTSNLAQLPTYRPASSHGFLEDKARFSNLFETRAQSLIPKPGLDCAGLSKKGQVQDNLSLVFLNRCLIGTIRTSGLDKVMPSPTQRSSNSVQPQVS